MLIQQLKSHSHIVPRLIFVSHIALLTVGLAWSSCDIVGLRPINAIVNESVVIECRSNCTPLRILYRHEGSNVSKQFLAKEHPGENPQLTHPYVTNATILLNTSFNNTLLFCKVIGANVNTSTVKILLQGSLESVKNVDVSHNTTHLIIKWDSPPVLDGIQIIYSIELFHENKTFHETVNQTHYSVPSLCPPCSTSYFSITPIAGKLRGPPKYIFRPSCTKGYQIKERDYPRTDNKIVISAKIEDNWCSPANATVTISCQKSQSEEMFLISEKTSWNISLPRHDLCNVTVSLQYSGDYTPSPNEPFNISYDTRSLTVGFDRRFPTSLCVMCHFASWSKNQTMCTTKIHSLDPQYKDKGKTCFKYLTLNRQYKVNITVNDGGLTLHYALLGGTSNGPTGASSDDNDNDNGDGDNDDDSPGADVSTDSYWYAWISVIFILAAVVALIVTSVICIFYFRKKKRKVSVDINKLNESYQEQQQESKEQGSLQNVTDSPSDDTGLYAEAKSAESDKPNNPTQYVGPFGSTVHEQTVANSQSTNSYERLTDSASCSAHVEADEVPLSKQTSIKESVPGPEVRHRIQVEQN